MADINDVRKVLYNEFINAWNDRTPINLDNEKFAQPESSPWVRFVVRNRISAQSTLGIPGNRKFLREGAAFVQVFIPVNTGTFEADKLAEAARDILEGRRLSEFLWTVNVDVREVGPDGKWYQVIVEASFTFEKTK